MLRCPKCGRSDLIKAGSVENHGDGPTGVQRWTHSRPGVREHGCKWNGCAPLGADRIKVSKRGKHIKARRTVVITSAQNATPVWTPGWLALKRYCKINDAELLVIPYRYKNPTSIWSEKAEVDDWWADEVLDHLYDYRFDLCPHLTLLADIKTQPTAKRPLSGFETISGNKSAIVGHPKLEWQTVPTPQQALPKIIVTTGSITQKNYTPTKAGKQGEFHHTYGAVVVEFDEDGLFFLRHLNITRNGSFCDLEYEYDRHGRRKIKAAALVMGDTHVDFADPSAVKATFGEGGIVDSLKPAELVWHDVLDFYSGTHHHDGNVMTNFAKYHAGRHSVEQELNRALLFVDLNTPKDTRNVFVYSNHNDMLQRWVQRVDPKRDPENAVFWAKSFVAMLETAKLGKTSAEFRDPFEYWAEQKLKCYNRSVFLGLDQSHTIHGIEVGMHGHAGPSGSRGSLRSLGKIGEKFVIGHSHAPGIIDGGYQVGTTSYLELEFVKGPSAWLHTHCVIYPNGKRALINIINGKWRP